MIPRIILCQGRFRFSILLNVLRYPLPVYIRDMLYLYTRAYLENFSREYTNNMKTHIGT